MKPVNVIIGSGAIAQAIARRISIGKHILLADIRPETAEQAAKTLRDMCSHELHYFGKSTQIVFVLHINIIFKW